ncbi:hypothetical protein F5Y12DRAFT_752829 [Xylaria sp. FL1777]|nr:hypothetical protein F5Y12DRAFT_752829 [Xylaria sp. FL1777]
MYGVMHVCSYIGVAITAHLVYTARKKTIWFIAFLSIILYAVVDRMVTYRYKVFG